MHFPGRFLAQKARLTPALKPAPTQPFHASAHAKMPVGEQDLTKLGDMCNTICYWLTAHIAAVAAGALPNSPPEVAQIYQLASKLPQPDPKKWGSIIKGRPDAASGAAGGAAGEGHIAEGAKAPGKRMKWTPELEEQLVRLVDDEDYRSQVLGELSGRQGGGAACSRLPADALRSSPLLWAECWPAPRAAAAQRSLVPDSAA